MFDTTYFDYEVFKRTLDDLAKYTSTIYICKLLLEYNFTVEELIEQMGFNPEDVKKAQVELDQEKE